MQWILKHCMEYDRRWQVPSQDKKMEWPFESGEKKLSRLGADPGFQVFSNCGGRRENFWGISCEKITILYQKIIFFPIAEGSAKIFGVFRVKNHDIMPKNLISSNFRRGRRPGAPHPLTSEIYYFPTYFSQD